MIAELLSICSACSLEEGVVSGKVWDADDESDEAITPTPSVFKNVAVGPSMHGHCSTLLAVNILRSLTAGAQQGHSV